MIEEPSLKRLRKKARRCVRVWPGDDALYGPYLDQATQVAVGISAIRERRSRRDARLGGGSSRQPVDAGVVGEILEFMEKHGVLTIAMSDGIIGCRHQEGIDHEGESCPVCEFRPRSRSLHGTKGSLICREINVGIRTTARVRSAERRPESSVTSSRQRYSRDRVEEEKNSARRADL